METFLRQPAAKITRADACVTRASARRRTSGWPPLEADRGVHDSGADGDDDASDDGHAGNGTGEGRRERGCTKTTVEHPGRRPSPIQDAPSVEFVEESGVGVWITEPLHRPVPAGRGGIVARSEIAWRTCATVSWGTLRRKQDHGSTGSEALWPHDGVRGSQVSGPEGLLGEMLPGGSRQRFVTEIGVTPGRAKP
jgi:hypothetical protein